MPYRNGFYGEAINQGHSPRGHKALRKISWCEKNFILRPRTGRRHIQGQSNLFMRKGS